MTELIDRLERLDWSGMLEALDGQGFATTGPLLEPAECGALAARYDDAAQFRSRVVMSRHGYGQGEYQYFQYPLPEPVATLRSRLYPRLADIANRWSAAMGSDVRYPARLDDMLRRCHAAGQTRATPLLLKYETGDYNCLHRDLYGEHLFPLQATFLLSSPGGDFGGGEFVLVEQRPRMQSRAHVVPMRRGEGVIFAVHQRPVQGKRGTYRVGVRHGVSRVSAGRRLTAGVIFHDAA
jgi:hypothetical protein